MRTREDAIRSTRRFVASALGAPPWRVRMAMDDRFKRPIAIVNMPIPSPVLAGGVETVMQSADIFVQLFPAVAATASENKLVAERAGDLLTSALILGVPDIEEPEVRGYRERIPLWDYTDEAGVPLPIDQAATNRTPRDYLRVAPGWRVHTLAEAPDDQLFTTIAEFRVQWFRNAKAPQHGLLLEAVRVIPTP